jgi:hypothetical protein
MADKEAASSSGGEFRHRSMASDCTGDPLLYELGIAMGLLWLPDLRKTYLLRRRGSVRCRGGVGRLLRTSSSSMNESSAFSPFGIGTWSCSDMPSIARSSKSGKVLKLSVMPYAAGLASTKGDCRSNVFKSAGHRSSNV